MKKIWEFFENMDECMYVADIDTHELIYMNKKALNIYGFKSVDEVVGKKCYEILQNSSSPCKICNNEDLSVGQFKEWRYFNPILNKHFILISGNKSLSVYWWIVIGKIGRASCRERV